MFCTTVGTLRSAVRSLLELDLSLIGDMSRGGTSFAWLSPDGKLHRLQHGTHLTWAKENIADISPGTSPADAADAVYAYEQLFRLGWVAVHDVVDMTTLHGWGGLTEAQCQAIVDMFIDLVSRHRVQPDDVVTLGRIDRMKGGHERLSVVDLVSVLGGREAEDRLFQQLNGQLL